MLEQDIRKRLTQAALPIPPLPKSLLPLMTEHNDFMFSTKELISSPYDLPEYLSELSNSDDDFFALGQVGYGINNWIFYYYLKWNHFTLALQTTWGGANVPSINTQKQLQSRFSILKNILLQVHKKNASFDGQLIAIDSVIYPNGWGWKHNHSVPVWHEDNLPVLEQVQQTLMQYP